MPPKAFKTKKAALREQQQEHAERNRSPTPPPPPPPPPKQRLGNAKITNVQLDKSVVEMLNPLLLASNRRKFPRQIQQTVPTSERKNEVPTNSGADAASQSGYTTLGHKFTAENLTEFKAKRSERKPATPNIPAWRAKPDTGERSDA
jgi:hypothetical protein